MAFLREQNKRLDNTSAILNSKFFNDVEALKSKISEFEGPVIAQVHPYKPFPSKVEPMVVEPTVNVVDKGKQKVVGVKISEPTIKSAPVVSQLDIDLENARTKRDILAKDLEKAENEAIAEEMKRKIHFLKLSTQTIPLNQG